MVATAGALGNLGASLFVGGWVDTHSRRSSLLISLVVRFAAWLAIAVLISVAFVNGYLIGAISMISGAAAALYRAAEAGALKAIIAGEDFPTALSVTEARGAVADLSGGPLGAAMMSISAALPFWFNSASYLASLAGILGVKTKLTRPPADGSKETFLHLLKGSISYLGSVPSFRYLLAGAALSNFAITAFNFAFIVLLQKAGESTWVIGLFQAAIGVGLLFGSVVAPRLIRRLTVGRLIVLSAILKTAIMLSLVVFHANVPIFLACTVVGYAIAPASSAAAMSYISVVTPHGYQGRVASAEQFFSTALIPLAPVVGAFAVSVFAPGNSLAFLFVLVMISTGTLVMSRAVRQLPRLADARDAIPAESKSAD